VSARSRTDTALDAGPRPALPVRRVGWLANRHRSAPDCSRRFVATLRSPAMKMLRRAMVALGVAALVAGVLRLRGTGGVPPQDGGWRELSGRDLT
jgi:hypothetical protein